VLSGFIFFGKRRAKADPLDAEDDERPSVVLIMGALSVWGFAGAHVRQQWCRCLCGWGRQRPQGVGHCFTASQASGACKDPAPAATHLAEAAQALLLCRCAACRAAALSTCSRVDAKSTVHSRTALCGAGFACTLGCWGPQLDDLLRPGADGAPPVRVLVLDNRGVGRSSSRLRRRAYSVVLMAEDVLAILVRPPAHCASVPWMPACLHPGRWAVARSGLTRQAQC